MPTPDANKERSYNGDYMAEGRFAEEVVMAFLKDYPGVIGIEDFRNLRAVHEADIDCAIKTADGRVTLAEIKSDRHLGITGNVLFEVLRINHTCQPDRAGYLGWSFRSPATYFLYFSPKLKKVFLCRANDLRQVVQAYTKEHRKAVRLDWVNTDAIKSTVNILLPWDVCKQVFKVYDVSKYIQEVP